MPKYRKKPVVVQAELYTGDNDNFTDLLKWSNQLWYKKGRLLIIDTLEGKMEAQPGDYIIKGMMGEFYPCKPDIFKKTYEPVDETS